MGAFQFIMVEHESHLFSAAGQAFGSGFECVDQVVEGFVEHIGQDGAFDMAPHSRSIKFRLGE